MINVYITCPNEVEAKTLAKHLLNLRLIACANIFPIKSLYWWEESIKEDSEFALLCKTRKENYDEIKSEVEANHSYTTPLIEFWNVDGINEPYFNWLKGELRK